VEDEKRSRLDTLEVLEGNHIAGRIGLRRDVTTSTKDVYGCLAAPAHCCLSVDNGLQTLNECDYVNCLVLIRKSKRE
jgi:hypothetical protein